MADTKEEKVEEVISPLQMTDEEFLASPPPQEEVVAPEEVAVEDVVAEEAVVEVAAADEKVEEPAEGSGEAEEPEEVADKIPEPVEAAEKPVEKDIEEKEAPETDSKSINYEAEYKRLLQPFKANGRDVTVDTVDDAISLMQMGANYNKKMAGLKPSLKILKLLENNGLLSEEKLSFLIDLDKKNPEAINKLVKDSGLDPMELDAEKAGEYAPKTHSVDDRELELDSVLDDIQGTPTYNRTLDVISKEWDSASKRTVAGQPQLLKVINDHMASGIYDQINTEVERGRMLGHLNGVSDIEAYRKVGDAIQANGGFDHLGVPQERSKEEAPIVVTPKTKKVNDPALKDKRRAAGSTPAAAPTAPAKDFNPLSMSDEEFSKLAASRYA